MKLLTKNNKLLYKSGGIIGKGFGSNYFNDVILDTYAENMVAAYKFESGALTTDSHGSCTLTAINYPLEGVGKSGGCVDFERDLFQYFIADEYFALQLSAFTISLWVKIESPSPYISSGIFTTHSDTKINYDLMYVDNNKFRFEIYDGIHNPIVNSTTNPSLGTWYHVVCVCTGIGGICRLYINGVQEGGDILNTAIGYYSGRPTTNIGTRSRSDSRYALDGMLDEIYVWNIGLSSEAITALYNAGSGKFYNLFISYPPIPYS